MKVAWILPGGVDRGGIRRVIPAVLWLLQRLALETEVHVFALRQGARRESYPLLGATVHASGSFPRRVKAMADIVREHRRAPFDVVHGSGDMKAEVVAAVAGRLLGRPSFLHLTGGELAHLPGIGYGGLITLRGRVWMRLALGAATRVAALSIPVAELAVPLGLCPERLPLGVDAAAWPPRSASVRISGSPARLVHVGSLNRVKDQAMLVRALAILRDRGIAFHADVVGEDTLDGEVHALVARMGLEERITFHGFLPNTEVREVMKEAHLHIVSSLHEAGPVTLLEAAATGVPTVGTAVGHVREWAPKAAVAVPVADPEALAGGIQELLTDEERRLTIARAARERALAKDADWTAERVLEIYDELTGAQDG